MDWLTGRWVRCIGCWWWTTIGTLKALCRCLMSFISSSRQHVVPARHYSCPVSAHDTCPRSFTPGLHAASLAWRHWLLSAFYLQQQQRPFNGLWSGTTRVGRYQKKHSPILRSIYCYVIQWLYARYCYRLTDLLISALWAPCMHVLQGWANFFYGGPHWKFYCCRRAAYIFCLLKLQFSTNENMN